MHFLYPNPLTDFSWCIWQWGNLWMYICDVCNCDVKSKKRFFKIWTDNAGIMVYMTMLFMIYSYIRPYDSPKHTKFSYTWAVVSIACQGSILVTNLWFSNIQHKDWKFYSSECNIFIRNLMLLSVISWVHLYVEGRSQMDVLECPLVPETWLSKHALATSM